MNFFDFGDESLCLDGLFKDHLKTLCLYSIFHYTDRRLYCLIGVFLPLESFAGGALQAFTFTLTAPGWKF